MQYPVIIKKDGRGFLATFPDIPEAITGGDTHEETLELARDALITAFEFYFEDQRMVPEPSKAKKNQELVHIPASVWTKVLVLNAMLSENVTQAELARRMGTRKQEMQRLINLKHATKIDQLDKALLALGKEIHISIR